jgi:hypothetical protein
VSIGRIVSVQQRQNRASVDRNVGAHTGAAAAAARPASSSPCRAHPPSPWRQSISRRTAEAGAALRRRCFPRRSSPATSSPPDPELRKARSCVGARHAPLRIEAPPKTSTRIFCGHKFPKYFLDALSKALNSISHPSHFIAPSRPPATLNLKRGLSAPPAPGALYF